jgi:alpha-beta hydrolase superfamily lysophospholipase
MPESWLTALVIGIAVLAVVNAAIFLFACYEFSRSSRQDPWLRSTQVLNPPAGNAAASAILLHGFGGTPRDFRALAERLAVQGFRVVVPEVPEQTSTSFAYGRGRLTPQQYVEWLRKLIAEETSLTGRPPVLAGISMGGTLATMAGADRSVSRLVLIAPYFDLAVAAPVLAAATRGLRWIVPVVPKVAKGQIVDKQGYREYETGSYLVSMRAFLQLDALARMARAKAPEVSVPTLVFASEKDTVASFRVTERLFRGNSHVSVIPCNGGNHILTYDCDRERIVTEVVTFFAAITPQRRMG